MDLTSADSEGVIAPALPSDPSVYGTQAMPWDDPYPYYRCMIPKPEVPEADDPFPMPDGKSLHAVHHISILVYSVKQMTLY